MKRIINILFTAIVISSAVSCVKQLDKENTVDSTNKDSVEGLVQITFDANVDPQTQQAQPAQSSQLTRTTYESGRTVAWEADDKVSVFSVGGNTPAKTEYSISELSDDRKSAKFTGLADETATHYYAVYPHSEATAFSNEEITVSIPSVQTAFANGFASGSNVCVARAEAGTKAFAFKNISSLICFSFNTEADALNTKSVTIRARKSEAGAATVEYLGLTGEVKVTYNEGQLYKVSEGTADYVVVNAPAKGFEYGKTYFVPVAPVGDVNGFEVTFTDKNDTPFVMRNDNAVTLDRNKLFNLSKVPDPYLPSELDVVFDFSAGWPFNEEIATPEKQVESWYPGNNASTNNCIHTPNSYTFNFTYPVGDNTAVKVFKTAFAVGKGFQGYRYRDGALTFYHETATTNQAYGGFVQCPVIRGRYLSSITVEDNYSGKATYRAHSEFPFPGTNSSFDVDGDAVWTVTFPYKEGVVLDFMNAYGFGPRTPNVGMTKITFHYSSTKPE